MNASAQPPEDAAPLENAAPSEEAACPRAGWHWWPRSMVGQLVGLLLAGLLVSHLATVLALRGFPAIPLNPVSRDHVFEHLASAYRMAQTAPEAELEKLLLAMSSPDTQFRITSADEAPPVTPESVREPLLRAQLAVRLPEAGLDQLRVRLEWHPGPPDADDFADDPDDEHTVWVHAAARLPDGRWLHSVQQSRPNQPWWWWLRWWLPASALPVLAIVIAFIYRTLRPIKALARAAEQVSRGERVAPLPLVGPREAREVSAAFNRMQERLDRFVRDRTRMLAAISHDFRTPITALRLRAELVDDPAQRAAMVRILDDMRTMVEQTLNFARDEAASEATEDVDLPALLDEMAGVFRAQGHDVALDAAPTPEAPPCRARPVALKRAIGNLLGNAVRHGRHVRMRLRREPALLRIEIDDDGPGIAPELLERAFEPFYQGDHARGGSGGAGLGLPIARSCARAHGGDLQLANLPEGGLRAVLTLPGPAGA